MTRALKITTNGEVEEIEITTYQDLSDAVGGWIEAVPLSRGHLADEDVTMYCNEEGKLDRLPINTLATALSGVQPYDVIVGDVVLIGGPDEEGEDTNLPLSARSIVRIVRAHVAMTT